MAQDLNPGAAASYVAVERRRGPAVVRGRRRRRDERPDPSARCLGPCPALRTYCSIGQYVHCLEQSYGSHGGMIWNSFSTWASWRPLDRQAQTSPPEVYPRSCRMPTTRGAMLAMQPVSGTPTRRISRPATVGWSPDGPGLIFHFMFRPQTTGAACKELFRRFRPLG